jgi:hypothetical protein
VESLDEILVFDESLNLNNEFYEKEFNEEEFTLIED